MSYTNAEHQARWRARQKAKFAALESALRQAQAAPPPKTAETAAVVHAKAPAFSGWSEFKAEGLKTQNALLQMKITELRRALKQAQAAKAPPSEVEAENAKLTKDNERLKQANRDWQARCRATISHCEDKIKRISKMRVMPKATFRAII
jgi:FtsZ-binding cell division protein ZapB